MCDKNTNYHAKHKDAPNFSSYHILLKTFGTESTGVKVKVKSELDFCPGQEF